MHFGANPVNPPLLGQPQMQGLAPVITTAGMMQPPLHAMNQLAASQYPQNDTTADSGLTYCTTQQGMSAPHSNGDVHLSPSPPLPSWRKLKVQHQH